MQKNDLVLVEVRHEGLRKLNELYRQDPAYLLGDMNAKQSGCSIYTHLAFDSVLSQLGIPSIVFTAYIRYAISVLIHFFQPVKLKLVAWNKFKHAS